MLTKNLASVPGSFTIAGDSTTQGDHDPENVVVVDALHGPAVFHHS